MAIADSRRFQALIEPHLDSLFRAAFRLSRNRADAEDLVQETCVRAYEELGRLRQSVSAKPWLMTVMHNLFVDGTRRTQRSPVTAPGGDAELDASAADDPNPEESACMAQREEELSRAWSRLDRGQRALLALRAEGYSVSEITEIAGIPTGALHARLYRARWNFARYLREETERGHRAQMEIAK